VENQGCALWASPRQGEDPVVYERENIDGVPWEQNNLRLSEHLIITCIFEAVIAMPFGCMACGVPEAVLSSIAETVIAVAIPAWLWFSTRVYCGNGIAMSALSEGDGYYTIWLGAHSEIPLQFLHTFSSIDWDYRSF